MPFTSIKDSNQWTILAAQLEKHCEEFGIDDGPEHEALSKLAMIFYHGGASSIRDLAKALEETRSRNRRSMH